MKTYPIYHVGRFARVTHRRVGVLWLVIHKVTSDSTWWRHLSSWRVKS